MGEDFWALRTRRRGAGFVGVEYGSAIRDPSREIDRYANADAVWREGFSRKRGDGPDR